uniref:Uncharacterized protein n=1 Tax=Monodon monoceros TaxID=40151 RepID=A0A8C6BJV1_MONMO
MYVSVKHELCTSFVGSRTEVFSQHGLNLLRWIKFTVLFQAKFWCGVNAGYILFFYILENKIALI